METVSTHRSFGGMQYVCKHMSAVTETVMRFSIYVPPVTESRILPVVYFLAGLTCTDETFVIKAGAQRYAADLGLIIVCPDTSPPKLGLEHEADAWDFGFGAGFYIDATQSPWASNYKMFSYVTEELPTIIGRHFPQADRHRQSIMGHSMGGHGALICALKATFPYVSVSAFAPIASLKQCEWGRKALLGYLGDDERVWDKWDATNLLCTSPYNGRILVDQGLGDAYLATQLNTHLLVKAATEGRKQLELRMWPDYDHSYFFISSFIKDHLNFHAEQLAACDLPHRSLR
jgi:S-formylglutathione hydrolase